MMTEYAFVTRKHLLYLRSIGGVTAAARTLPALVVTKLNCAAADESDATRVVDRWGVARNVTQLVRVWDKRRQLRCQPG